MWLFQISEPRSILVLQHKATNQHGFRIVIDCKVYQYTPFGQHPWTKRMCFFPTFGVAVPRNERTHGHNYRGCSILICWGSFTMRISHISTPATHPKRHRNIVDFDWTHLWFGYIPMLVECTGFFDKSRVLLVKPAFCWWNADLLVWPV